jgi:CO dehydrogenase maturation factor
MTTYVAIVGKGGTGKTAISSLLIDYLSKKGVVLAIDADPSTNLNTALGMNLSKTVGAVREKTAKDIQANTLPAGVAKLDILEQRIRESLVEGDEVDLLAMGRPEGPGCYCAANTMLRQSIDRLGQNYKYVVIDNEAGMEHLSRRTTRNMDALLLVTDPTKVGVETAGRLLSLAKEMELEVKRSVLAVNGSRGPLNPSVERAVKAVPADLVLHIPHSDEVHHLSVEGMSIWELGGSDQAFGAVRSALDHIL